MRPLGLVLHSAHNTNYQGQIRSGLWGGCSNLAGWALLPQPQREVPCGQVGSWVGGSRLKLAWWWGVAWSHAYSRPLVGPMQHLQLQGRCEIHPQLGMAGHLVDKPITEHHTFAVLQLLHLPDDETRREILYVHPSNGKDGTLSLVKPLYKLLALRASARVARVKFRPRAVTWPRACRSRYVTHSKL